MPDLYVIHQANPRCPITLQKYVDGKIKFEGELSALEAWTLGRDLMQAAMKGIDEFRPLSWS